MLKVKQANDNYAIADLIDKAVDELEVDELGLQDIEQVYVLWDELKKINASRRNQILNCIRETKDPRFYKLHLVLANIIAIDPPKSRIIKDDIKHFIVKYSEELILIMGLLTGIALGLVITLF